MIAYYNPNTGDITGIAWTVIPSFIDPYIETDDPLLLKFLSREENSALYKITMVDTADSVRPQLVLKEQSLKTSLNFREKVSLVPKYSKDTEIVIEQEQDSIVIKFTKTALEQWQQDPRYKDRACVIVGSASSTPYFPVWSYTINISDLDNLITNTSYNGPSDIRFFSNIPFNSISHKTSEVNQNSL